MAERPLLAIKDSDRRENTRDCTLSPGTRRNPIHRELLETLLLLLLKPLTANRLSTIFSAEEEKARGLRDTGPESADAIASCCCGSARACWSNNPWARIAANAPRRRIAASSFVPLPLPLSRNPLETLPQSEGGPRCFKKALETESRGPEEDDLQSRIKTGDDARSLGPFLLGQD